MNDLISRQDAIDAIQTVFDCEYWVNDVIETIEELPSTQAEWVARDGWTCPVCGYNLGYRLQTNYCPNCGVEMKNVERW